MSNLLRQFLRNSSRCLSTNHASNSSTSMHPDSYDLDFHRDFNRQKIQITKIEQHLHNWSIHIEAKMNVYQIGIFDRWQDYLIETTKHTILVNPEIKKIQLLEDGQLAKAKALYKFLHIGLVQVVVKPPHR